MEKRRPLRAVTAPGLAACIALTQWLQPCAFGKEAQVKISHVSGEVKVVGHDDLVRRAQEGDVVTGDCTLRTGSASHIELTIDGKARARFGAGTVVESQNAGRDLELKEGVALLYAPKWSGHIRIRAGGVCAIAGNTTSVVELHENTFKFLVMQGVGRIFRPGHIGDSVLVNPGQMVIGNARTALSDPVDFDLGRFVKTCRLLNDLGSLGNEPVLARESARQAKAKSKRKLIDTNLVIFGEGTLVTLTNAPNPAASDKGDEAVRQPGLPNNSMPLPRTNDQAATISR